MSCGRIGGDKDTSVIQGTPLQTLCQLLETGLHEEIESELAILA
jgi:hypothetical protein